MTTTNTQPTATGFPEHPYADNATELGEYYYRRMTSGLKSIELTKKDGRYGPMGEDHIEAAQDSLSALDGTATILGTLNLTQARQFLAGLHNESRNTLAELTHRTVHETQPEFSDACDDPDCTFATLQREERNALSALNWIATLAKGNASTESPTEPASAQAQQGLRRAIDEAVAGGRYPNLNWNPVAHLAANPDGSATPNETGVASESEGPTPLYETNHAHATDRDHWEELNTKAPTIPDAPAADNNDIDWEELGEYDWHTPSPPATSATTNPKSTSPATNVTASAPIALAALRAMCLSIRQEWPDAVSFTLGQSDQGDHAYMSSIEDAEGNDVYEDTDWEDEYSSSLSNATASTWLVPDAPYIQSGHHGERNGFQNVVVLIDQCLEFAKQPRLLPNEVEVWVMTYRTGDNRHGSVLLGSSEADCWDTLREMFVDTLELAVNDGIEGEIPNEGLGEYLSIDIDEPAPHLITNMKEAS